MTAPKPSFDPPIAAPVADANGKASVPYQQFHDRIGKAMETVRQAANGMDELDASPTNEDIATVWNALRDKLQEIV